MYQITWTNLLLFQEEWSPPPGTATDAKEVPQTSEMSQSQKLEKGPHSYPLSTLAWLRSGDKGDSANIGVVPRHPSYAPYIAAQLGAREVAEYFSHKFSTTGEAGSNVKRYSLEGIGGLNFVLENSLGGGGIGSLTPDPQGKGYAQMLA